MNKVAHFNFQGHVAPESDVVAIVDCVKETVAEFGEAEFALSLVEDSREAQQKLAA